MGRALRQSQGKAPDYKDDWHKRICNDGCRLANRPHQTGSGLGCHSDERPTAGSSTLNVAPVPAWLSTQMRPCCASVNVLAIERPTPVSPTPWISTLSALKSRVKTLRQILRRNAAAAIGDLDQDG